MAFGKRTVVPASTVKPPPSGRPAFKAVAPPPRHEQQPLQTVDEVRQALQSAGDQPVAIRKQDGTTLTMKRAMPTKPALLPRNTFDDMDKALASQAGADIYAGLCAAYTGAHGGIHLETLIAAMAALTGEFALRAGAEAQGVDISGNTGFVLGGAPDPYLFGPDAGGGSMYICGLLASVATEYGAPKLHVSDLVAIVTRVAAAIRDAEPFPPRPPVPDEHMPHEWSPNACVRHRHLVIQTAAKHGIFGPDEITLCLGYAMVFAFLHGKQAIGAGHGQVSPSVLLTLATEIMVAVSRMAPLRAEIT